MINTEITVGSFKGALGMFATSAFGDLVSFGVAKPVAHQIATDYVSDLGKAMSKDCDIVAAVSKAKKDGTSDFKISGKSARLNQSPAMSLVRVAQTLRGLKAEKLLVNCNMFEYVEFTDSVQSYWDKAHQLDSHKVEETSEEVSA